MASIEVASKEEDHFRRLPKELLVDIFNRVADLKSLCFCSLVSKFFASLIPHVRTITFTLPDAEAQYSIEPYLQKLKLPDFLGKFSKLESVYLEYVSAQKLINSSLIKWKIKCRNSDAGVETFVAIFPVSGCNKKTEYEHDQEQLNPPVDDSVSAQLGDFIWRSPGFFAECLCLMSMLVKSHSSLRSVTVTDSEKQSKFVIKDEQLAYIRRLPEGQWEDVYHESDTKMAWLRVLHLPLSGYIMRDVCLVMINVPTESSESDEYDGIMNWEFEEHENLLGEAVKEILKNHRHKIMSER